MRLLGCGATPATRAIPITRRRSILRNVTLRARVWTGRGTLRGRSRSRSRSGGMFIIFWLWYNN
jgi:hypothetical protein